MAASIDRFYRFSGSKALSWLLIINLAIFLSIWVITLIGNHIGLSGNFTIQWLCVSSSPALFILTPWTCLTYMATQYSFLHLLFNMLWLFWFGRLLQTTLSDRHLLTLYIGGGLSGALFFILSSLVAGPSIAYLSGASAAVLAIITACAFRTPDLRLMLILFGEVKLKWVALVCIVLTFLGIGGGNSGAQGAHIGGLLFGMFFSLMLKKGKDLSKLFSHHSSPPRLRQRRDVRRDGSALAKVGANRISDVERLDQLLDKIRLSGYSSLTNSEKRELNALSRKLDN